MARTISSSSQRTSTRRIRSRGSTARSSTRRARTTRPHRGRDTIRSRSTLRALPRRSRASAREREVQAFFDRFTTCLTTGDGQGASACFEYPALMVMANAQRYGNNQALGEPSIVAQFFERAPKMYHDRGIEETFADLQDIEELANDLLLVRAHFPYIDADGNDMGDGETSLYVLRRSKDGLFICAAIPLGTDADRTQARRRRPRPGDVGDQRR